MRILPQQTFMLVLLSLLVLLTSSTAKAEQSEQKEAGYSWEQLIDVAQKCFNETGLRSDLISWKDRQQQIENAKMQLEVMQEEADVLNQAMVQDGVQGIREYYKVKKDIAKTQAILKVAQKKYEAILRACGKQ